jgi:hypothetical protein
MKGSKSLEYNTGFTSGNSMGIASYISCNRWLYCFLI